MFKLLAIVTQIWADLEAYRAARRLTRRIRQHLNEQ